MTLLKFTIVGRLLIRVILKVAHEFHSLLVKNTSQTSSQSSTKSASQPEGNRTSDYTGNRIACYGSGKFGHLRRNCPSNPGNFKMSSSAWMIKIHKKFMCCGSVNGTPVSPICRDTGCSSVIISDSILPDTITTNVPNVDVYDYLGRMDIFPVIKCYLRCPYYTGWGECYTRSH